MIAITNQIIKQAGLVLACAVIAACSADVENPPPLNSGEASAGNANFSKFVAIGDSLTAGYNDGTLYLTSQQNSFPNILAQQFAAVGGGEFSQPLVGDPTTQDGVVSGNLGGLVVAGNPILHPVTMENLFDTRFALNTQTESPERLDGPATIEVTNHLTGEFNNMGVPGMKSFHVAANGYGNPANLATFSANPYYVRFAQDTVNYLYINDLLSLAPSFVTLWLGNNDVLLYAAAGGYDDYASADAVDQNAANNTSPATYGPNDISHVDVVENSVNGILSVLKGANPDVQGVIANVPNIRSIPHFTVIPYNAIPMTADQAAQANAGFQAYNDGLDAVVGIAPGFTQEEADSRKIVFAEGANGAVILDQDLTDLTGIDPQLVSMRQANADDIIVFSAGQVLGTEAVPGDPTTVYGVGVPLEDKYVLIPSELSSIEGARTLYNVAIRDIANADDNFAFIDMEVLLAELNANGYDYGNGSVTSEFATGGMFSLDGIHPTGRGYAIVANEIINTINASFDANVYKVDPATYPTVLLK